MNRSFDIHIMSCTRDASRLCPDILSYASVNSIISQCTVQNVAALCLWIVHLRKWPSPDCVTLYIALEPNLDPLSNPLVDCAPAWEEF